VAMAMQVGPTVVDCAVSPDLASLSLTMPQGQRTTLSAERLRVACQCAHCRRARFDNRFPAQFPGIAIVGVTDLGYGLNIAFSDGHDRGIYPKPYLSDLANA
jgi:DUF971 family protein